MSRVQNRPNTLIVYNERYGYLFNKLINNNIITISRLVVIGSAIVEKVRRPTWRFQYND